MTYPIRMVSAIAALLAIAFTAFQPLSAGAEQRRSFTVRMASPAMPASAPQADLLILGHSTAAQNGLEAAQATALVRNALVAARLREPEGPVMVLIAPDGRVVLRADIAPPRIPAAGMAFRSTDAGKQFANAEFRGFRLGIATIARDELVLDRMAELGVDLVLVVTDLLEPRQVQHLSSKARSLGLSLFLLPNCQSLSPCPDSLALPASGPQTSGDKATLTLWRSKTQGVPSALGLPSRVPWPAGSKVDPALIELGRRLFFSPVLSADGQVSCASCHKPELGFADNQPTSAGAGGRETQRNAPGLLNVAFRPGLRWDAYPTSIEQFIKYPVSGRDEMNAHDLPAAARRAAGNPGFAAGFQRVFGSRQVDFPQIEIAIGAYVRTLVSGNSAFDRAMFGGQPEAMSASAWRGFALFGGRAGCSTCHTWTQESPFFSDGQLHATGWGWDAALGAYVDEGAGALGTSELTGQFRTPTLRDLTLTGPYMHDGRLATLREVIEFFNRGGGPGPGRSPSMRPLHLTESDMDDLEQFLIALTGESRYDQSGRRFR